MMNHLVMKFFSVAEKRHTHVPPPPSRRKSLKKSSSKDEIDTKMKFSLTPSSGQSAFDQWKDAMKAVNRLPLGIPADFRKKVWLSLADRYVRQLKIDWQQTVRLAFNERSNPDDHKLGLQIVKDLHRTGCSNFTGQDNEEDRVVLKRVLLAYARWNKRIGYCQGFNVIAALLLNVLDKREDDALKVMIYLVDHVLPESYFDNNLRALSVDMAVHRDLLKVTLPHLSAHLDNLRHAAQDVSTGACYEPPLTNVFTMQWLLTLFATCLPKDVVLRVWDTILLEGSEVLLRTALCLWGTMSKKILSAETADEFYCLMGDMSADIMQGAVFDGDSLLKAIYGVAPFPFPLLSELREKYTYNIRPFSSTPAPTRRLSRLAKTMLSSDEEEPDEEELRAIAAFPGLSPTSATRGKGTDISVVGPGAFGAEPTGVRGGQESVYMERMSTDMSALKMQYNRLKQRQRQAHVIIAAAVSAKKAVEMKQKSQAPVVVPKTAMPLAINHLFVGKIQGQQRKSKGSSLPITSAPVKGAHKAHSLNKPASSKPPPLVSEAAATYPANREDANRREASRDASTSDSVASGASIQDPPIRDVSIKDEATITPGKALDPTPREEAVAPSQTSKTTGGRPVFQMPPYEPLDTCDMDKASCVPSSTTCLTCNSCSSDYADSGISTTSRSTDSIPDAATCEALSEDQSTSRLSGLTLEGCEILDPRCSESGMVDTSLHSTIYSAQEGLRCSDCAVEQHLNLGDNELPQQNIDRSKFKCSHNRDVDNNAPHLTDCNGSKLYEECSSSCVNDTITSHQETECIRIPEKSKKDGGEGCDNDTSVIISRSQSLPTPLSNITPTPVSPSTPPPSYPTTTISKSRQVSSMHPLSLPSPNKNCRPFNPFPVKHVNTNRARTGLKLGLYTPSTLETIQGQRLGPLVSKKGQ